MRLWFLSLLAACTEPVPAIVAPNREGHLLDAPFPDDALRDEAGHPDLSAFPLPENALLADVVQGWVDQAELSWRGWANNGAVYFRTEAPVALPAFTSGIKSDPIVMIDTQGLELIPLEIQVVADPAGDPFWAPNTIAVAPQLGFPLRSGATYVVALLTTADVSSPEGYSVPALAEQVLTDAEVIGDAAVATVFTVQDPIADLEALATAADGRMPSWGDVALRRVVRLDYAAGLTPSGRDAVVETVTYEDGGQRTVYLEPDEDPPLSFDLVDWPMIVYEADLGVPNFQELDDRPYMSPGLATLGDVGRFSGWIEIDDRGVVSEPWIDTMRITVSLPKGPDGAPRVDAPVVLWDHGTGGDAYNIVHRPSPLDDGRAIASAFADAGWAVVGRDATLYGARYPLIDEGYDGSLGFYNIVNLPAFRDNQRQTAVDGHALLRFVQGTLNEKLPAGSVDPRRIRRAGHSLGAVTSNLGVAMEPRAYESVFLFGTGGIFSEYFLSTGLTAEIDPELIGSLLSLLGAEVPPEITPASVFAAALGASPEAAVNMTRLHPLLGLFQGTMDPSDPMAVARGVLAPAYVVVAPGDRQTPDFLGEALAQPRALPFATLRTCEATSDYDPHQCIWREAIGPELVREWLATPGR